MTVVEDSRAKVSIMCACCSCVSCASRVSLSGNTGHRDCWVALCRVASLICPHQVQGVPAEQSYGMGEMLGTMVVPPLWHIGARAMPTVLGAAGWALPPCPPCQGQQVSATFLCLSEKPGTCPPVNPGIPMLGVCANQCKTDANCSGAQKCCRNGCGKVSCVTPIH